MEDLIEDVKAYFWALYRNIRTFKKRFFDDKKSIYCHLGFHKMKRGFGWSQNKRMDVCLRNGCSYSKWHKDEIGCNMMKKI